MRLLDERNGVECSSCLPRSICQSLHLLPLWCLSCPGIGARSVRLRCTFVILAGISSSVLKDERQQQLIDQLLTALPSSSLHLGYDIQKNKSFIAQHRIWKSVSFTHCRRPLPLSRDARTRTRRRRGCSKMSRRRNRWQSALQMVSARAQARCQTVGRAFDKYSHARSPLITNKKRTQVCDKMN